MEPQLRAEAAQAEVDIELKQLNTQLQEIH
jgi:hypothetical protein